MTETRIAIVTGGSGGLAPGIARVLGEDGYRVVLVARTTSRLALAAAALAEGDAPGADFVACDVTDAGSVAAMVAAVVDRHGRIDLLVNAAASSTPIGGSIESLSVDALIADMDTKVGGYLRCIQAVVPAMKARGGGGIVNIGGLTGRSSDTLSGLRNAAVSHLTKVMADELGPAGITVNAVHPGLIRTPHLGEMFAEMAHDRGTDAGAIEAEFVDQIPTRRISTPEEVGAVVAFLAGAPGASVNGESITVDGGYSRGIYL